MRIDGLDGSSLRGALKGFFHNGVCAETVPGANYDSENPSVWTLTVEMARAARGVGLGGYRRLHHIADHWHAALAETGAVLASAVLHEGWRTGRVASADGGTQEGEIPLDADPKPLGAHAFAVVGYTPRGFLVLNSQGIGGAATGPGPVRRRCRAWRCGATPTGRGTCWTAGCCGWRHGRRTPSG